MKKVDEESTLITVSLKLKTLAELLQDTNDTLSKTVSQGIPFLLWDMAEELDGVINGPKSLPEQNAGGKE